ncbi:heavy metal translocating P-type ATPase [Bdellovibrio svalbardensis]|uniref:Heavy metal translocating P-type ATPase n=1 Tax=Bdellovibrio svalbardensis TaxID=2972972 RepID=A0ABT6DLL3_9BACT|nr:heavy metal translocating P-type ATPase [Bdellovibrio svalbardensis]MDG0816018.1 heavy metal translocating P-type ATPase [Bdellovibrio svalbardensis]
MEVVDKQNCQYCGALTEGATYCCTACEILDQKTHSSLARPIENPYSYLDQNDFRNLYRQPQGTDYNFLFFAEGLHCSSCVHLLEKLPQFCEGVSNARVNFGQSTVAINLDDSASLGNVALAIQELGYKPSLLSPQDDLQEKYKLENRRFLMRIAVAGFCAGNTMLFVIPVYAGLAGSFAVTFNWISFLLFLPILLYSAVPFYQGAWNSLKYKIANVDLPITIALLTGFSFSTYNLIRGDGSIYFDSTASFMFFILSARYLLKRVQQNYLAPARASSLFQGEKYLRIGTGAIGAIGTGSIGAIGTMDNELIPWNKIAPKDRLLVKSGQTLPVDCELISVRASLDMSLYNGESLPKDFTQGMTLFAGSKVLNDKIEIKALTNFERSRVGQLFKQLDQQAYQKSNFVTLTDRLAQKLIVTVFATAILFFAIYFFVDPSEAFNRSLALIVLACPCALAFGSPLTLGLALKKAQSMGMLIKNANSLERILAVKNIFFDKTGTLTEGALSLVHTAPTVIPADLQKIILSLEAHSYHPIAFALRKAWKNDETLYEIKEAQEILGKGVRGLIDEDLYEIRHLSETTHDSELGIEVFKNHESLCRLYFVDSLRKDSPEVVAKIHSLGLNSFLLSGDRKSRVKSVAQSCHIPEGQCFAELFPEDKKDILERYKQTCMIGDGANDSLCLQQADVGIAVKGSVDLSLQSADVYFTRGGLMPLLDLIALAQQARKVLIRNLSISLIYNTLGAVLALSGFINPMMAAILMPISSVIIILSSLWGLK